MPPHLIADSVISIAAVLGLIILYRVLKASEGRSPLNRRFLFAIIVIGAMIFARVLQWFTGIGVFGNFTFLAASLVPLAALLITEGVLRRHAPRLVKLWAVAGTAILILFTFLPWGNGSLIPLLSLAAFQMLTFLIIGYLVLTRDRDTLSEAENLIVTRLALSLLLILPFALSDFRTDFLDPPVRLSGVAILVMCWLVVSLGRGTISHLEIMRTLGALAFSALGAGISVAWLADMDFRTTVQTIAIVLSAALLVTLFNEARALRRDRERDSLLGYLASADWSDPARFLHGLQRLAMVRGALVLSPEDLKDFDEAFFAALTAQPIRRKSALNTASQNEVEDQFRWFFEKFGVTHALLITQQPVRILALNLPPLAASQAAEFELQVTQKVAQMLSSSRDASHD